MKTSNNIQDKLRSAIALLFVFTMSLCFNDCRDDFDDIDEQPLMSTPMLGQDQT